MSPVLRLMGMRAHWAPALLHWVSSVFVLQAQESAVSIDHRMYVNEPAASSARRVGVEMPVRRAAMAGQKIEAEDPNPDVVLCLVR
jgi:hypothetical protein